MSLDELKEQAQAELAEFNAAAEASIKAVRTSLLQAWGLGDTLIAAQEKAQEAKVKWVDWLKDAGISHTSAKRWMKVARSYTYVQIQDFSSLNQAVRALEPPADAGEDVGLDESYEAKEPAKPADPPPAETTRSQDGGGVQRDVVQESEGDPDMPPGQEYVGKEEQEQEPPPAQPAQPVSRTPEAQNWREKCGRLSDELEKANERITALEANNEDLRTQLEAKDKRIEELEAAIEALGYDPATAGE